MTQTNRRLAAGYEGVPLTATPYLAEQHDTRFARAIIWTVAVALTFFAFLAAQIPVYEVVSGRGALRPEGLSRVIEHLDGGVVGRTFVADGDRVSAGDLLVELDTSDLRAEARKLEARLGLHEQNVARYRATLDLDLVDGREVEELLAGASPSIAEEVRYRLAQLDVLRNDRAVAVAQREASADRIVKLGEELSIMRGQRSRYANAGKDMIVPVRQLEALDREIIGLESSIRSLESEVAVHDATLARLDAQEIELVSGYRREAALRLEEESESLNAVRQTLDQVHDRIARAALRAPIAGVVHRLELQSAGEVIEPGEAIMEIVPENSRVFAEIDVPAERIGGITAGQEASLKVLTYDFTRYGDLTARVERISPSSIEQQDGRVVFRVKLVFDAQKLEPVDGTIGGSRDITPGMTVLADIQSDRRTILSYLLKPLRMISDRALTEA